MFFRPTLYLLLLPAPRPLPDQEGHEGVNARNKVQGSPEEDRSHLWAEPPVSLLLSRLKALRWHVRVGVLLGGYPTSSPQCSVVIFIKL